MSVELTDEEARLVCVLLVHEHPQIDLHGLIGYFGITPDLPDEEAIGLLLNSYKQLCARVGFEPPPMSCGDDRGPKSCG